MNPTPNPADGLPLIGDLIGGKFRVTETLGQGGMGVVLGGEHVDLRQAVAIKLMRPALAREPDALARFLREARAAASIKSGNAVRIYDVGTTELGVPYMVMERLHGIGVDALLERDGALSIEQAVSIVVQAAEAIAEANGVGIVHRDVKPSNLFLANDPSGSPVVKVLDFGISKRRAAEDGHESASLTAPQTLLGSPHYMSPEQLRDPRSVDERSDVWGLGVTLYELLTARLPFESESIAELCALVFNSTPVRVDVVRPESPSELADVIEQCLAKDANRRIPTVAALVGKLVPFCRGEVAKSAAKLGATAVVNHEGVRVDPPLTKPRSRSRNAVVGATAASAALGLALFVRGQMESTRRDLASPRDSIASASEPNRAVVAATAATELPPALGPDGGPRALDDSTPAASSTVARPRLPAPPSSMGARPRGLKGIKLME